MSTTSSVLCGLIERRPSQQLQRSPSVVLSKGYWAEVSLTLPGFKAVSLFGMGDLEVRTPPSPTRRDQDEEHAGGWLSVVPHDSLGSRFVKGEYQLLLEFQLGLPLLPGSPTEHPCDKCGQPLDVFGDLLLTCRYSGLWKCQNFPRDVNSDITTSAGLRYRTEACVQGKARPADVLLYEWDSGRDLAVDLTVRHPLTASGQ